MGLKDKLTSSEGQPKQKPSSEKGSSSKSARKKSSASKKTDSIKESVSKESLKKRSESVRERAKSAKGRASGLSSRAKVQAEKASSKAKSASKKAVDSVDNAYGETSDSAGGATLVAETRKHNKRSFISQIVNAVITGVACFIVVSLSIFVVSSERQEVYFQVDPDHRFTPLVALHEPNYSDSFVADWLNQCIVDTFDFYYDNYSDRLSEVTQKCYSQNGRESLHRALTDSGNLDAVRDRELFLSIALNGTPMVVRSMRPDNVSGAYQWLLQAEGTISLRSRTTHEPNNVTVTAVVSRASHQEKPIGLNIDRILIRSRR